MGLSHGAKWTTTIGNDSLDAFMNVMRDHHCQDANKNIFSTEVDAHWLLTSKAGPINSTKVIVANGATIITTLSKFSTQINPVCDPDERYHTKRASIDIRVKS